MPISIDASELQTILAATPIQQNVLLVGRHGIGKSEIIRDFYESQSMPVIPFFLGQMSDPGDLIGLLHKNEQTGRSEFLPPAWWPSGDKPVVLFLDELNRGRPEILQSVMELTLSKTLAGKQLPAGSIVIAAVNDGDEYQLTDLDPALVSRFNVYHFEPTLDDWSEYASRSGLDRRVIDFIEMTPHWLDGEPTVASDDRYDLSIQKTPDRRAWTRVAAAIAATQELEPIHFKMIAGIVGGPAAAAFRSFLASRLPVTTDQIFAADPTAIETAASLTTEQIARLNELIIRKLAADQSPAGQKGVLAYLQSLDSVGKRESIAHFVSLIHQSASKNVNDWLASSIALTTFVAEYMDSIATTTS